MKPMIVQISGRRYFVIVQKSTGAFQSFEKGSATGKFYEFTQGEIRFRGSYSACHDYIAEYFPSTTYEKLGMKN